MRLNIHVIDADEKSRWTILNMLKEHDWTVHLHPNEADYLKRRQRNAPSCLIMDVHLPSGDGLDFQHRLRRRSDGPAVIFLSANGTIPDVVKAMKQGAIDFLTKPISEVMLRAAVHQAHKHLATKLKEQEDLLARQQQYALLTKREKEVFALVVAGHLNKVTALMLEINEGTVKVHRRNLMRKFQTKNLTELVRIAELINIKKSG